MTSILSGLLVIPFGDDEDAVSEATGEGWVWRFNGYEWGPGRDVTILETEGLDLPSLRTSDSERPGQHGMFSGRDLAAGRTITQTLQIIEQDATERETILRALESVLQPSDTESVLSFQIDGREAERVYARLRRRGLPYNRMTIAIGRPVLMVEWYACDPRIYSDNLSANSTGLPEASGGFTFDLSWPLVFGELGTGGTIPATNSGNTPAPWTAVIAGPVLNPSIESVTDGKTLTFALDLASDESLVIDSLNRTALLNGTASRYSSLSTGSQWFDLLPGSNEIRFGGVSGTGSLQLSWRSARL